MPIIITQMAAIAAMPTKYDNSSLTKTGFFLVEIYV